MQTQLRSSVAVWLWYRLAATALIRPPPQKKNKKRKEMCIPMFTEVLFTIAKIRKQSKCPLID